MRKGMKMPEWVKKKISDSEKGKFVSKETREKNRLALVGQKGEKCRNWLGDKVGYHGIHDWLALKYGKASKCEGPTCNGISTTYQWAKLKGLKYERKRENFWQLCSSCHNSYDMTPKTKLKISKALKKYYRDRHS